MDDTTRFVLQRLADCRKAFRTDKALAEALHTTSMMIYYWRKLGRLPERRFRARIDTLFYLLYPHGQVEGVIRRTLHKRYRRVKPLYDGFIDGDGI